MSTFSIALLDQHAAMLAASGITPDHARARGYVSVDTKKRLDGLGIAKAGQRVPGLLVPSLRPDGSTWGYQYRPDSPRDRQGKPVKYETPIGQRNGIDVPPGVGAQLGDPSIPLWVTEGAKKADAGALAGLCVVDLPGVWSWLGTNSKGGKVALNDWHDIALNGRRVVLAFDGDVSRKRSVRQALDALAGYLSSKGARVEFLHLPDEADKVGLDDYLVDGHDRDDLLKLVRPEPPVIVEPAKPAEVAPVADLRQGPPEDGAELLDDVETFLARFVAFPSEAARVAVTLWATHAHLVHVSDNTPRLALLSPEPGSGKTRTLEVVELLTPRPMHVLSASPAAIFRTIEAERPTLLMDEVDSVFGRRGSDDGAEDLRGLLNAGHRAGATIPRCVGPQHDVRRFPVFAAVALAGLGDLPDTLMSRSVIVRMRRRAPGEKVEPFRHRVHAPQGEALRERLAGWAESVAENVADAWPDMPPGVEDRPADVWEPLLAVADAAGGHWPDRARVACVELVKVAESRDASLGVKLLGDLRMVFGDADALPTETILSRLCKLDESPWADLRGKPLDPRGLARRLRQYDVHSVKVKVDGKSLQGYRREHLWDTWQRYLPPTPESPEPMEPEEPRRSGRVSEVPHAGEVPEPASPAEPADPPLTWEVPEVPEVPLPQGQGPHDRGSGGSGGSAAPSTCPACGQPFDDTQAAYCDRCLTRAREVSR